MRAIIQDIDSTIAQVSALQGETVRLKINRGRNKIEYIEGKIENAYPKIFTIRSTDGNINSFSYNDILSNNIYFARVKN